jgi:hypothetical protein
MAIMILPFSVHISVFVLCRILKQSLYCDFRYGLVYPSNTGKQYYTQENEQNLTLTTTMQTAFEIHLTDKKEQFGIINFDKAFLEATDLAFSLLGNSGKQAIYYHLEKNYGLTKGTIPQKVEAFENAIRTIFGEAATLIEMSIMRSLHESVQGFKYVPKKAEFSFKEYVECLRRFNPI